MSPRGLLWLRRYNRSHIPLTSPHPDSRMYARLFAPVLPYIARLQSIPLTHVSAGVHPTLRRQLQTGVTFPFSASP